MSNAAAAESTAPAEPRRVEMTVVGGTLNSVGDGPSKDAWLVIRNDSGKTVNGVVGAVRFFDYNGDPLEDDSMSADPDDPTLFTAQLNPKTGLRPKESISLHFFAPTEARRWAPVGAAGVTTKRKNAPRHFKVMSTTQKAAFNDGYTYLQVTVRNKTNKRQKAVIEAVCSTGRYYFGYTGFPVDGGLYVGPRRTSILQAIIGPEDPPCDTIHSVIVTN